MNEVWGILGIGPTDDKRAIRKAYAAQTRLHHPEEEPEYFAALNQAYKTALEEGAGGGKNALSADAYAAGSADAAKEGSPSACFTPGRRAGDGYKEAAREGMEGNQTAQKESSLLERLGQAEEQAIKKSMETGALHEFIALFENPRQAKQADAWKRFFLSEAFLGEQFSAEFGKGLYTYLWGQAICPRDNLPMGLLQELAIAYAFIPHFAGEEYFEGLKYPKEWYKVSVEDTFPARKYAADIFNMQGRECDMKSIGNRIQRQPANKVRHNAFSDYLAIKEMSRDGRLSEGGKEGWQQILGACQAAYLYERNGKQRTVGYYESRSESVVKLYAQLLKDEQLPREVLLFLYKKLDFKELERSSTKGLYSALKEGVLRQCPQAEEILFGEGGKGQRIAKLYKTYVSIINANQCNYDKFIYGETPEIRDRVNAFFALPEWEQLKGEKELFGRIYSASKRIVMPRTLAETLVGHLCQGDFPEPERTELAESLLRSLSTERMCQELDYRYEIALGGVEPGEIGGSPDFWQYYLMRGFGFRHARIRGSWEENFIYTKDGECYLPAYINYIYAPSRAWQRRFVGFDEEKGEIGDPVGIACPMPGNRTLRVEFHYHYCLYFVDGVQADAPVLAFSQLREYAEDLEKPEEFFFLLAVTAIGDFDRSCARALIETWLKRIPLHPFIIPTIARLLAADNGRIPAAEPHSGEMPCQGRRLFWGDKGRQLLFDAETNESASPDAALPQKKVEAVLYNEQERFCFCALVWEEGFGIWRQMDYGWQDIIFRSAELGWQKCGEYTWSEYGLCCEAPFDTPQGRKAAALNALRRLRQPKPQVRASYPLEGMDMVQKAGKILEAMGCFENMEGYCVLRYGDKKEKRHDRVFYGAHAPFGFRLEAHSMAYARSRDYLMASSNTKIKEPKILVGRFGWGFKYLPRSDYGPMYVYQGESGKFYAYGAVRMYRADSLEQLLADFFREEWEGVEEVEAYEGCLTVSRLDHRLEYCYTQEDMRQSMSCTGDTAADKFTLFGGYGMWAEFVRWMDGILNPGLPSWVNVIVVGLDWERGGVLTFTGIHEDEICAEIEGLQEKNDLGFEGRAEEDEPDLAGPAGDGSTPRNEAYLPQVPLLVWAKGMDRRDRAGFLADAMQWYVDCGRFAEKTGGGNIRILVDG